MEQQTQQISSLNSSEQKEYQSFSYLICLVTCYSIGIYYMGFTQLYFNSISFHIIYQAFHISIPSYIAQGILSGVLFLGATLGALITAPIQSKFSRRSTCLIFNGLSFFSGILVLIPNQYCLLIGRFFQGVSMAAYSIIIPITTKQMLPLSVSGTLLAYQMVFIAVGFFTGAAFVNLFSLFAQQSKFWIIHFGVTLPLIFLQSLLLSTVFSFETPKYLLLKGRTEDAKAVISRIYSQKWRQHTYHRILKDLQADNYELESTMKSYPEDSCVAIGLGIFILMGNAFTGINIIILYQRQIALSVDPEYETVLPIIINLQKLVSSFFAIILFKCMGRITIFKYGSLLMALSLLSLSVGLSIIEQYGQLAKVIVLLSILSYVPVFVNSWGALTWLYPTEILEPVLIPYLVTLNWLTQGVIVSLFPIIRETCSGTNCPFIFIFFSFWMVLSFFIFQCYGVETKDKTSLEIRQELNLKQVCSCQ